MDTVSCMYVPTYLSVPESNETINTLRHRLDTMKEIFGENMDATETAQRKRTSRRRNGNCIGMRRHFESEIPVPK